jgi:hypothetical protein
MRDLWLLISIAAARILLHALTNGQYGFHRDELATIDDARYLDWGYVAYPPVTPFIARVAMELFGPSLVGIRFFASLAQGVVLVLSGLMARSLGGGRPAVLVAALAVAIAPLSLASGTLFQYVAFDFLWWVLAAYCMIRLLQSENPRWWLGVGAAIGFGMLTKYSMLFLVAGIAVGVVLTPARRYLRSPWLWGGVVLSLLIFLPNFIWQWRHDFISLEFLRSIHERDVRIGRTDGFLSHQLLVGANLFTLPLWIAGFYFYFRDPAGRRFRPLGWMYLVPLILFTVAKGRDYYLAPAYPMLLAAGSVVWERWVTALAPRRARLARIGLGLAILGGGALVIALILPIAPVNSAWWEVQSGINGDLKEEIGWQELADTVAKVRDSLPEWERARLGILTGNYGEAGAINLYGPARGLPKAISGTNSYWLRGYGNPPPETLIVLGLSRRYAETKFVACEVAARTTNRFGVLNEETKDHPEILVCRGLREPWPEFWKRFRHFG